MEHGVHILFWGPFFFFKLSKSKPVAHEKIACKNENKAYISGKEVYINGKKKKKLTQMKK